jgi:hypothetical protein
MEMANASSPSSSVQPPSTGTSGAASAAKTSTVTAPNPAIGFGSTGSAGGGAAAPQNEPPADVLAKSQKTAQSAGTTWNSNQLVNGLWSINQDRNSWVGVAGVGWVKLSGASDTGIVALTMLSSHAKQLQSSYNFRTEADGLIHEIYAW